MRLRWQGEGREHTRDGVQADTAGWHDTATLARGTSVTVDHLCAEAAAAHCAGLGKLPPYAPGGKHHSAGRPTPSRAGTALPWRPATVRDLTRAPALQCLQASETGPLGFNRNNRIWNGVKGRYGIAPLPGSEQVYDRELLALQDCTEERCKYGINGVVELIERQQVRV